MLPDIAWSISVSVGEGFFASNAVAAMIWPDWQYPHCTTSRSSHACWTFLPTDVAPMPSMVVMAWPTAALTGVTHDRRGMPSRFTVQAPHSAAPQPNFVPVMPSRSRKTQSRGISGGASTERRPPLMVSVITGSAPWWSSHPPALFPTHPLPDVWRAMHQRDAVGLAGDKKPHHRDVHQRHRVQVGHEARPESPYLGFELAQIPRLEAANEPER